MENDLLEKTNNATVTEMPDSLMGFIKKIEQKKASEIYPDTKHPDQPVFVITVENDDFGISSKQSLPYYEDDRLTSLTKLGRFKNKYEKLDIGVEVELRRNGNYYEVVL